MASCSLIFAGANAGINLIRPYVITE